MHIYAFGSVCRGEVSPSSDIDLLAVVDGYDTRFDTNTYSVYSYKRIHELWKEGNPFAWHLSLESRLLFSSDHNDLLKNLGSPEAYKNCVNDCEKFFALFCDAHDSMQANNGSTVFDLSTIFLSIRNIATCFSLGTTLRPDFSRNAALRLGADSIGLSEMAYQTLERARILCVRGYGASISNKEVKAVVPQLGEVHVWMKQLLDKAKKHERIQ